VSRKLYPDEILWKTIRLPTLWVRDAGKAQGSIGGKKREVSADNELHRNDSASPARSGGGRRKRRQRGYNGRFKKKKRGNVQSWVSGGMTRGRCTTRFCCTWKKKEGRDRGRPRNFPGTHHLKGEKENQILSKTIAVRLPQRMLTLPAFTNPDGGRRAQRSS